MSERPIATIRDALCQQHRARAVGTCGRCGDFVCAQCSDESRATIASEALCSACAPRFAIRVDIPWESGNAFWVRRLWQTMVVFYRNPRAFADGFADGPWLPSFTFALLLSALTDCAKVAGLALPRANHDALARIGSFAREQAIWFLFGIAFSGLLFLVVRIVGGRGRLIPTLRTMNYGDLAALPLVLTNFLEGADIDGSATASGIVLAGTLVFYFWFLTRALARRHQISPRRTAFAVALSFLVAIGGVVFMKPPT